MIKKIFTVFDSKARVFGNPFFAINEHVACRDFKLAATDPGSSISKTPEDFSLFEIGSFDDLLGVISPLQNPITYGLASSFIDGSILIKPTEED